MPSLNVWHDFNYGWYAALSGTDEVYKFKAPPPGGASDAAVQRFSQVLQQGRQEVIDAMEKDEIFSMSISDGAPIYDSVIAPAESITLNSAEIWTASEGETILEEAAEAGEALAENLAGVVMVAVVPGKKTPEIAKLVHSMQPAFFASGPDYSIKIINELMAPQGQPKPVLTLVKWHLVDHWWVNRSQSPPDAPLQPNDEAHLSWSFPLGTIVSGGILGYYDGYVSYELPNGKCFGVRIHIPTQVGPLGTRPSYQTKYGSKEDVKSDNVDKWDYHDDPTKKFEFPDSEYSIALVPTSGSSSLALEVQVRKKK